MTEPDIVKAKVAEWRAVEHSLNKIIGMLEAERRDVRHNIRVWEGERGTQR